MQMEMEGQIAIRGAEEASTVIAIASVVVVIFVVFFCR
jgi:hypothetical protein